MAYEAISLVPRYTVNELAAVAKTLIPTPCGASFLVPFPYPVGLAQWIPGPIGRVMDTRLVGLLPSQQIVAHADAGSALLVRYHVCLRMNPGCWSFSVDGVPKWQQIHEGIICRMDPTVEHGAVNWGDTIRLHLIIDVEALP